MHHTHHNQLLKVQQVAVILAMCKATVWAHSKAVPDFPKPFKLSAKQTRWKLSEVDAYIELRAKPAQH
jgi:predicted DNA-binding transcriptional regulator AlpA